MKATLGKWRSKSGECTVEVKKIAAGLVWYEVDGWRTWQSYPEDRWHDCMEPVEAENLSPSNVNMEVPNA